MPTLSQNMKTNAARHLDSLGIIYELRAYEVDHYFGLLCAEFLPSE